MNNNVAVAEAYYTAMAKKDAAGMEKCLHAQAQLKGPVAQWKGKSEVIEAAKKLFPVLKALTIRAKFGAGDQTVIIFDLDLIPPLGNVPSASFMTFQDGLIAKIELFFDARPFEKK